MLRFGNYNVAKFVISKTEWQVVLGLPAAAESSVSSRSADPLAVDGPSKAEKACEVATAVVVKLDESSRQRRRQMDATTMRRSIGGAWVIRGVAKSRSRNPRNARSRNRLVSLSRMLSSSQPHVQLSSTTLDIGCRPGYFADCRAW